MVSKDQAIGTVIFVVCLAVAVGYVLLVATPQLVKSALPWLPWTSEMIQFGAIAIVVLLAFLAIMFIGAWIGWTMATTPPPKPIEELEKETEEEKPKTEEKPSDETEKAEETVTEPEKQTETKKRRSRKK
ncbi:MAG: hypothetical protein QXG97_02140 [Nitrososphaerota archaeon]